MKKQDVPQDHGVFGQWHGICYVTDENGKYVTTQSSGWEPTNVANGIAWEFIQEEIDGIAEKVKKGELSPLAYHMAKNLMDVKMLAQYSGISSWKVKRHFRPRVFNKLTQRILEHYAVVFKITIEQLRNVP